jgi:threonine dehydrogenase-like Zn-dependent dehydrogenase
MKILQVTGGANFELLDVPVPEPGPGQVLVRVLAVTTCPQWDLHLRHNEPMFVGHHFDLPYTPGQPGHEATGAIEAVGEGAEGVAVGDRVSVWRDQGHDRWGCYAQYAVIDAENVIRVPPDLPFEATAPVELAMCVGATFLLLKSLGLLGARRFGVTGLGPAGLVAAQMARAEGATEVIGFDISPRRRAYALQNGFDAVYDPRDDLSAVVPFRHSGRNLDCAVDCVGAKSSVEFLMDRTVGAVALFGVQREPYTFAPHHYGNLILVGYPGHSRAAAEYAVNLIRRGNLDLTPLVTDRMPLERYAEGVDRLESQEAIKVCFFPWETA